MTGEIPIREKFDAVVAVAAYWPSRMALIVVLNVFVALMEGVGLGFIIPIVQQAQRAGTGVDGGGIVGLFGRAYAFVGLPFTVEYIVAGVAATMTLRYLASFAVSYLSVTIQMSYIRHLQTRAYLGALGADIEYLDERGSDDVLNAIITQAPYCGDLIEWLAGLVQQLLLALMYVAIALYVAPLLTVSTAAAFGLFVFVTRGLLESGYSIGDRVADANERLQETVQAGVQGSREVRLFGLGDELADDFRRVMDRYIGATVTLGRNEAAMRSLYQFLTTMVVFGLIYVGLAYAALPLAELGVFLFAVYRLAPRINTMNNLAYSIEGILPHLVRTQAFIDDLEGHGEPRAAGEPVPTPIERVAFEAVSFAYDDEDVLRDVSFAAERGEFVAFVGPSGAGKSTVSALIARMYDPDAGEITANGTPIHRFELAEWRSRVSMVRQTSYLFDDTLRYNLTVGNRDATQREIDRVCEVAQVTEFLDELPDGYDTQLGDNGVRLSGGQRQRVAIARALLKDDADVLILDEATSELDAALERRVHAAVADLDREFVTIAIAHRLATVTDADRIYTFERGAITEAGDHRELLDRGGTYADLYAAQSPEAEDRWAR